MGVRLSFRIGRIVILADIETMFRHVKASSQDAESLRFIWFNDIESEYFYILDIMVISLVLRIQGYVRDI